MPRSTERSGLSSQPSAEPAGAALDYPVVLGEAVAFDRDNTVLELFQAAARRTPNAPAVTFGSRTLSYRELDQRSNGLARSLAQRGFQRGEFLPLAVADGVELPLSMIAGMKLGTPFVPVDDDEPAERFAAMVDTLGAKAVLRAPSDTRSPCPVPVYTVDDELAPAIQHPPQGARRAALDELVYGFYTSGSTGTPKCALNLHAGLLNRFAYMTRRFGTHSGAVVLQNSKRHFDSSLWQLLWPLTIGNRVIIPQRANILDLASTIGIIETHRVTMTDFVPSVFNALVELLRARPELRVRLSSLRRLLIGGEEISVPAVAEFRAMLPDVSIVNTYGPTEAAIGSIFHEVTDSDTDTIPIGLPIDNTYAVIVDEHLCAVSPGEVGEICIGGECLGAGYLNDPGKTATAFVDNPFARIPGRLLYRTGDRGYLRADGLLQFVGRLDNQVKINGLRIELSEVERALLRHDGVRDAKVIVHGDGAAKMMAGFLTATGEELDAEQVRAQAEHLLPKQMVPPRLFVLDRIPLTPNGKADRRALMRIAAQRLAVTGGDSRGEAESAVLAVWRELLPLADADTDTNFFELGGDSLGAQRLAVALTERARRTVTVREIFERPTLGGQAGLLTADDERQGSPPTDAILWQDAGYVHQEVSAAPARRGRPRRLLLTGATGFVGVHLLAELLRNDVASVHCLVRAADHAAATERLTAALRGYRLWDAASASRIFVLPGDLAAPRLGLHAPEFAELAEQVDAVVHCGATVNLLRDYRALRAANVLGTAEILRLATTGTIKPVHHISTIGAYPPSTVDIVPEGPVPTDVAPAGGYAQSKWAAERLLSQAAQHGLPVSVHRLAEAMPHTVTGVPNPDALPELLARACLRTGTWFSSPALTDYTPVDLVSGAIVAAVLGEQYGYFHPVRPDSVPLDVVLQAFAADFSLTQVGYLDFYRTLRTMLDGGPADVALSGLLAVLPEPVGDDEQAAVTAFAELFAENMSRVHRSNAQRLAESAGQAWPVSLTDSLRRYVAFHRGVETPARTPIGERAVTIR